MALANAIELRHITKAFGSVIAAAKVSLSVRRGEILSLLGENGSGKTTLMNILSGIYFPDSGQILIDGREVSIRSPKDAIDLGIGMVHQHFKLVDVLSAAENIVLGLPGDVRLSRRALADEIRALCEKYGFQLDPNKKIHRMSVSEKQTVEIIKVLYRGADILILDEPTAVLTPQETERLFSILRAMKEDGKAVVLITHKLGEVLAASDRVTILRKGHYAGTVRTKDADIATLTGMMVGRTVKLTIDRKEAKPLPLCHLHGLTVRHRDGHIALSGVDLVVNRGEILGIAGVAGSGQKELCEALYGMQAVEAGSILFDGKEIANMHPNRMLQMGVRIGFVPEDRLGMGLVGSQSIAENMLARGYRRQRGGLGLSRKPAIEAASKLIDWLEINTTGPNQQVSRLSGGNVQKVLLGRELLEDPQLLIAAYPVRGLDIGASYLVYSLLQAEKEKGKAVLFVGEDLDVLLEMCDRIAVLCGGRVSGIVDARTATKEQIGLLMTSGGEVS